MITAEKIKEEIEEELSELRYKIGLILSGVRNLLEQNNPSGVNDYLINKIDRRR